MPEAPGDSADPGPQAVDVGGYRIWIRSDGPGSPTVVFESGGGEDSSVWSSVAGEVRHRSAVTTVLYDRAGLGRSEPSPGPYRIDDEAAALRSALTSVGATGPLVLVAHSYGGFVSLLTAETDRRVAGLVFVDANVPEFFDDAEVARLLDRFVPAIPMMEREAPQVARVLVPLMRALPETARRVRSIQLAPSLPVIDIVAERTWVEAPEEVSAIRRAHAAFVAESPSREAVFAAGCGHYIMHDRPEVVLEAVSKLVGRLRA